MIDKNEARLRRARRTRAKIAELKAVRLTIHRSNQHMYAQLIDRDGLKVLTSASTVEEEVKKAVGYGGNIKGAAEVGKKIAERARGMGIESVAFDRSGYRYHGRVKALADAAREGGLKF